MTRPDHTERAALEAQIAAGKEAEAKLAALDAEPDWEAWRPALEAYYRGCGDHVQAGTPLDGMDKTAIRGLKAALPLAPLAPRVMGERLWLWQNFVDGKPEYWAFDNGCPCDENGDQLTLGNPVGWAIVKSSKCGCAFSDAELERQCAFSRVPAAPWPGADHMAAINADYGSKPAEPLPFDPKDYAEVPYDTPTSVIPESADLTPRRNASPFPPSAGEQGQ
jgi:hypothetical protein